jgi:predicted Zn-dependent protease
MGLTKSQSETLSQRVLDLVEADGASVRISDSEDLQLRYANNDITSNGLVDKIKIDLSVSYGKRSASIGLNQTDNETLKAAVKKVQAMAKLAPEDPEHMPELGPTEFLEPKTFSEATAALTPEEGLAHIRPVIEAARKAGVDSAGYLERSVSSSTFANSEGLIVFQPSTSVNYSLTARSAEGRGSGWASTQVTDLAKLDLEPVGARAIEKALATRNAVERAPGRTTVVLEPAAVRDLISLLSWGLGKRGFDEGRSFLNGLVKEGEDPIGKELFGKKATLFSDPQHSAVPCGIHQNGLPRNKTDWVKDGILKSLSVGRFWAQEKGIKPQPHPGNLIMPGEGQSMDELIGQVEDGVLITRLWYLRMVQPQTLLYTGLTRDGTFAIKDGKVANPVKNFRFNESPVNVLKNIVASGKQERVMGSEGAMPMYVPPLLVNDFNLSSVSDAS